MKQASNGASGPTTAVPDQPACDVVEERTQSGRNVHCVLQAKSIVVQNMQQVHIAGFDEGLLRMVDSIPQVDVAVPCCPPQRRPCVGLGELQVSESASGLSIPSCGRRGHGCDPSVDGGDP